MSKFDTQYLELCNRILTTGKLEKNRTGVNAYKVIHHVFNFDLSEELPILTTKFVAFKHAIIEFLWIYQAQSNDVRWLNERGVTIWDEWKIDKDGYYNGKYFGKKYAHTIGTAYGWIVNKYKKMDELIWKLKNNPTDRKKRIDLWQEKHLDKATLPSCVHETDWDVFGDELYCIVNQRSCDVPLGLPFNALQYAVLVHLVAHVTGYKPGKILYVINNAHIYENQVEGIKQQISNADKAFPAPALYINPEITDFYSFDNSKDLKDIKLIGYQHNEKISMPISV